MGCQRVAVGTADGTPVELAYEELGSGDRPLVLVHGFTGFRQDFETQWHGLAEHGRTLAPDLRGHGESTRLGRAEAYDLEALTADLVGFLRALELPPVDLLGHSMGGMIVLRAALAAPERVASLVLMNTSAEPIAGPEGEELELAGRIAREAGMDALAKILRERAPEDPGRSAADREVEKAWGSERFWAWRDARLRAMDGFAFEQLIRAMAGSESLVPRLGEISCPATVIVGDEDHDFLEPSETLAREIPGAKRAWITGAAHQPQHEQAQVWLSILRAHLLRVRA